MASQQARARKDGSAPKPLVYRDRKFKLPEKLPMSMYLMELPDSEDELAEWKSAKMALGVLESLLGDTQWEDFRKMNPSMEDAMEVYTRAMTAYTGLGEDEAGPFNGSSADTGTSAKPPSKSGSGSTSRKPASASTT